MNDSKPIVGVGHFHWNAGGWFGGLLGGTAFMIAGAIGFMKLAPSLSFVWFSCFGLSWAIGMYLWSRRSSIAPYFAIQCLLLAVGCFSFIAIAASYWYAPGKNRNGILSPRDPLVVLVIIPVLMVRFHFLERLARKNNQTTIEID